MKRPIISRSVLVTATPHIVTEMNAGVSTESIRVIYMNVDVVCCTVTQYVAQSHSMLHSYTVCCTVTQYVAQLHT